MWKDNTDNFRDWAIVLTDEEFRKQLFDGYSHMGKGMLTQRTLNLYFTKKRYADMLGEFYPDNKEDILSRLSMSVNDLRKNGIYFYNKFNQNEK